MDRSGARSESAQLMQTHHSPARVDRTRPVDGGPRPKHAGPWPAKPKAEPAFCADLH